MVVICVDRNATAVNKLHVAMKYTFVTNSGAKPQQTLSTEKHAHPSSVVY